MAPRQDGSQGPDFRPQLPFERDFSCSAEPTYEAEGPPPEEVVEKGSWGSTYRVWFEIIPSFNGVNDGKEQEDTT